MALGKNLKRKKLIEAEKKESKSQKEKSESAKSVAAKKQLIDKPKARKKVASKKEKSVKSTSKGTSVKTKTKPSKKPSKNTSTPIKDGSNKKPSKDSIAKVENEKLSDQITSLDTKNVEPKRVNIGLPVFIAEEIHSLKKQLREDYKKQVDSLRGSTVQFVIFQIGGESYAVDISVVKEVVPLPQLSKTPNTPDHIKGIANIRGNTYTVFDLAQKFKIKGDQLAKFLLVISGNEVPAALMIGSLPTTLKVKGDEITGSLNMIEDSSLDVSFIKGIIQHDEKIIYYLDIIELLKNDRAIVVPDKYLKGLDE